ncbi:hypothetical protein FB382_004331 [Nocardioides ginsengisegetis]|uniref:Uncharacterized protein n=1 Tax=Nocardioides ginsengisegetis TaxID=661491 RepID=A0A7W3J462_9ACTN|nr:hypothetical protein [Nocardioides ginsengisegetis]MBA8805986.1 hypothetical protein [Nocardioides ginsengisegetis]
MGDLRGCHARMYESACELRYDHDGNHRHGAVTWERLKPGGEGEAWVDLDVDYPTPGGKEIASESDTLALAAVRSILTDYADGRTGAVGSLMAIDRAINATDSHIEP